ncbi:helix-turn-helix domain-containing protein [Lampropedia puyangensis]|nr:helix-turn-helix domain-containing protein [Lampropedia puyangensis]
MSEAVSPTSHSSPEGGEQSAGGLSKPSIETLKTPGALLQHYRQERHVSLHELAAVLKVTPDKLDALERDAYEKLPDMVFTRALALSICRLLGADSAPVMALFPSASSPKLGRDSDGLNQPFKGGEQPTLGSSSIKEASSAPKVLLAVGALLLAAVAVYFWPQVQRILNLDASQSSQIANGQGTVESTNRGSGIQTLQVPGLAALQTANADSSDGEPVPAQAPESEEQSEETSSSTVAGAAPLGGANTAVVSSALTTAASHGTGLGAANVAQSAASAPAVNPVVNGEAATPVAAVDTIRIEAQEPVWVQIRDQSNAIVHQSTLPKGRELAITNAPPLRVEIGRADAVKVTVKGQDFDVHPFARGNVARFEVTP